MIASLLRQVDAVHYITRKGREEKEGPYTLLHLSCMTGNLELLNILLAKGAQVDAQDDFGATPCMFAVAEDHVAIVNSLVEAGARLDLVEHLGRKSM